MFDVDVVIPCYNYAHYLPNCVESVLSQHGVDVRILIVDDQSSDATPEVGQRLAAQDPRVNYVRNPKNLGLVGTANVGVMDWAKAKYTLLLSADDALSAGALARAASVMDMHDEVGMTYGMALVVGDDSDMTPLDPHQSFEYVIVPGSDFLERSCVNWCGVASPTALVRTALQHKVGGLDPRFPTTCDMEIWMRMATRSSVASVNAIQAYYRRHTSNMSNAVMSRPLSDLRQQLDTAVTVLTNYGQHEAGAPAWLKAMRERLVTQACWMAGLAYERGDTQGAQECLQFARYCMPSLIGSKPWLKYMAKRVIGRKIVRAIKELRNPDGADASVKQYDPFVVGELFGWWPKDYLSLKAAA